MRIEFNTKTKRIVLLEPVTIKELLELRKYFPDLDNWELSGKIVEVQKELDKTIRDKEYENPNDWYDKYIKPKSSPPKPYRMYNSPAFADNLKNVAIENNTITVDADRYPVYTYNYNDIYKILGLETPNTEM